MWICKCSYADKSLPQFSYKVLLTYTHYHLLCRLIVVQLLNSLYPVFILKFPIMTISFLFISCARISWNRFLSSIVVLYVRAYILFIDYWLYWFINVAISILIFLSFTEFQLFISLINFFLTSVLTRCLGIYNTL